MPLEMMKVTFDRILSKNVSPNFSNFDIFSDEEEEDEWPPFKKVGQFDPYR